MTLFYKDNIDNIEIKWNNLISELNEIDKFNNYCFSQSYYDVFKQIIVSLIYNKKIILLDSNFSPEELINLTGYSEFERFNQKIKKIKKIKNKSELLQLVKTPSSDWSVTLFTSGTTGLPKKVTHSFESISRFVKIDENKISNVWGFAYNPTHMAGIQVFFQALMNGNSIIRLFGLNNNNIFKEIKENKITNISATPSFYRLLLPFKGTYASVTHLTSGGEKFDKKTIIQLKKLFPNAKITNVYASTEAGTILASEGTTFIIKPEMKNLVKIENGELIIHKDLIGDSDIKSKWYYTGDMVEILSTDPTKFRFLSRKNETINVGGYKVNPQEVEELMRDIPGIKDVRVYSKQNRILGNIICSEVVKTDNNLDEVTIRSYLQTKLQEFKIPRMIKFVNKIKTTNTGKIKRN